MYHVLYLLQSEVRRNSVLEFNLLTASLLLLKQAGRNSIQQKV